MKPEIVSEGPARFFEERTRPGWPEGRKLYGESVASQRNRTGGVCGDDPVRPVHWGKYVCVLDKTKWYERPVNHSQRLLHVRALSRERRLTRQSRRGKIQAYSIKNQPVAPRQEQRQRAND